MLPIAGVAVFGDTDLPRMPPSAHLPIFEIRDTVLAALRGAATKNMLIKAPTGSGKSTQVPQFGRDSGDLKDWQR